MLNLFIFSPIFVRSSFMKTLFYYKLWEKAVNIGITPDLPVAEVRKIRLLNGIVSIMLIMFVCYTPLMIYLYLTTEPKDIAGLAINLIVNFSLLIPFYLNSQHQYHGSKIFTILFINLVLFTLSVVSDGVDQMEYGLIVMVAVPVIFFEKWETTKYFAFLSFALFWIAKLLHYYLPPFDKGTFYEMLAPLNLTCTFIALFFIIWNFKKEFTRYEETINQKNKSIAEQNEELHSQAHAINQKNSELAKKNKDITSSITYARRIQTALLPADQELEKALGKDHFFVFYQPRDIVSGDFYWINSVVSNQLSGNREKTITDHCVTENCILAVADCTGHGVPGALMSMIGVNLLNEIVRSNPTISPDLILNQLHTGVRESLKQHESQTHDGMDMAIVKLKKESLAANSEENTHWTSLEFAGAKNPLYWVSLPFGEGQGAGFQEIKADKMPIGGHQREIERIFTLHRFDLQQIPKNETHVIYLFTDGYQDQFGGENIEKFRSKRLKDLLQTIAVLPLAEQKEILGQTIEKWQTEGKQHPIDDRLAIGIRL